MRHTIEKDQVRSVTPGVTQFSHPLATVWLARENHAEASYFYGGTRLVDPNVSDTAVINTLLRLMTDESGMKNRLINWSIADGSVDQFAAQLPPSFLRSRVGGARCLIRPRSREIAVSLHESGDSHNGSAVASILKHLGDLLNDFEPRIKLTPDFGRYSGLADILHEFTPNVLGIACEKGGCGGKSSYATTGIIAALELLEVNCSYPEIVTCIGSAGALGSGIVQFLQSRDTEGLAVCDLVYDGPRGVRPPANCQHLRSASGRFTRECLTRSGMVIATTVGDELERSPWPNIVDGTVLFLAHNLALPQDMPGVELARALRRKRVLVIPGQVLTLGGALTARLESYWRDLPSAPEFDKALAHNLVRAVVSHLIRAILELSELRDTTPYEAMLSLGGKGGMESLP
jgi:hypothetical protein